MKVIELTLIGGNKLSYCCLKNKWFICNSVGEIIPFESLSETISLLNCEKIIDFVINQKKDLISICYEKYICFYNKQWEEINPLFLRTTLSITHCEFDSTGEHL